MLFADGKRLEMKLKGKSLQTIKTTANQAELERDKS
jgi:hypothetical protein